MPGRDEAYLRIGELSRRTGVSRELLRAWERRYGLLQPQRTPGGFRLYTDRDLARVNAMQANLANGLSAAEAARLALVEPPGEATGLAAVSAPELSAAIDELMESLLAFDEPRADALLDRLVAGFSTDGLLQEVLLPVLRELGERWGVGDVSIAQEHFATNVLRGRMTALGRGWGQGRGPVAVLACPEGELHDLPLVAFGLALRARGWRITFLGGDTPVAAVAEAARRVSPAIVVVAGEIPGHLQTAAEQLAALAREAPLAVAGAAATPELALRTGATLLRDDPVEAAERLSAAPPPEPPTAA